MKFEKDQLQMVMALFLVAVIAAALLGITDMFTREPIAMAQKEALHRALEQVLPVYANDPQSDEVEIVSDGEEAVHIYPGKDEKGRLTGIAWEVVAPDGYSGRIRILLGLHPDGSIQAIRVTDHRETPGLGDGIVKNVAWLASFVGRSLTDTQWAVKKDGGDFDQFTGATITPRAVVKAVRHGLDFYHAHSQVILEAIRKADASELRPDGGQ
ncbi:MAG TPA: RnfABCDGE type electron transport complex subunit G [Mariprofundaceae bacterium]|jgi:Na+-translocating ferredoxin:NAD+ oxidoreductase subunit G|nr:RnfABCDGE type electron transport complex subunit G [Mariprofundaceae bacterium]